MLVSLTLTCSSAGAAVPARDAAVNQALEQVAAVSASQVSAVDACPPADPGYATCEARVVTLRASGALLRPSAPRSATNMSVRVTGAGRRSLSAGARSAAAAITAVTSLPAAKAPPAADTPAWLQQAYDLQGLSVTAGAGDTVAIVDAYDDPTAESDLAVFRANFGLSACTTANGCFEKVNEYGQSSQLPAQDSGWNVEESLDLDAVSSLCPNCHILLVEANDPGWPDLLRAMQTAASMGARQISDSWSATSATVIPGTVNWPGVATIAATGDSGYVGPGKDDYPAASAGVTAAGGTSLQSSTTVRGFTETAWSGAGSGCDLNVAKPVYQPAGGCTGRAWADVSADADPDSGLAVYDSGAGGSGWILVGGTSLATPLVAAFEALTAVNGSTSQWAYSDSLLLNDPLSGSNGDCAAAIAYICNAGSGYDGPTGAGSISGDVTAGPPGIGAPDLISANGYTYVQSVSASSARLLAGVYPNGISTTSWLQYGTTDAYGESTAPSLAGAGSAPVQVSGQLTGLAPSTTYHFRLVAQNSAGTTYGYDYTLTTTAAGTVLVGGTAPVGGSAPVNTLAPSIAGIPQRLAVLTASAGQWSPAAGSYTYQWQRCAASGGSCESIPAATAASYIPGAADESATLQVQVTAIDASGQQIANSARVGPVLANPPVNAQPPVISAAAAGVGSQLTANAGSWSPSDLSFSYQWQDCLPSTCTNIVGAISPSYTIQQSDSGNQLRVVVSATNADGSAATASALLTVSAPLSPPPPPSSSAPAPPQRGSTPPVVRSLPRLAPDAGRVGDTLIGSSGAWTGTVSSTVEEFMRCTITCVPVGSGLRYKLVAADAGAIIRLRETVTGPAGTGVAYSSTFVGPVRSQSSAAVVLAHGRGQVRNGSGATLATVELRPGSALAGTAADGSDQAAITVVRVQRAPRIDGKLSVSACSLVASGAQPLACTPPRPLRLTITFGVHTQGELAIVVARS